MRKNILLVVAFALATLAASAQNYPCETLWYDFNKPNDGGLVGLDKPLEMVENRNGDIIVDIHFLCRKYGDYTIYPYCNSFYTISRQGAMVVDSSLLEANQNVAEDNVTTPLLERDPDGEGYIYAKFLTNLAPPAGEEFTSLEIIRLDENLEPYGEAAYAPLENRMAENSRNVLFEKGENIVVRYIVDGTPVLARVSLDGTVLDKKPLAGLFQGDQWRINGVTAFTDTPREYAVYGWEATAEGDTTFLFHVVDSLFNLRETVVMENESGHYHYFNNMISLLPFDDGTYYAVSQYYKDNEMRNGLRIAKYDKANHGLLGEVLMRSNPIFLDLTYCATLSGLVKSSDGGLYLGYRTCNKDFRGYIQVVKLDKDLDIKWSRYCHTMESHEFFSHYCLKELDHGLVFAAHHTYYNVYDGNHKANMVFFIFNDDGTSATPETEALTRARRAPPAILARRAAQANRALRPSRPPRAHPRRRIGKPQPARPRGGAVCDEGHDGGRQGVFGQGGEGMKDDAKAKQHYRIIFQYSIQ